MRKRKLLSFRAIQLLSMKVNAGIPLALAMRQLKLDMSRPAVVKLLRWTHEAYDSPVRSKDEQLTISLSLFPEWLEKDYIMEQEQPDNWEYVGNFPTKGEWVCKQ